MLNLKHKPGLPTKLLEAGLWLCASLCGLGLGAEQLAARSAAQSATRLAPVQGEAATDGVIGRMEIADLRLSVPVLRGYDAASLVRGAGHIPGTAMPGGLGNMVLAGHRDTFFRPLRGIRRGMTIAVSDSRGTWRYEVDRTEIVTPDEVRVLDIAQRPELTLITCYPFEFLGAAPKRFIVHAHLVSAEAE